LLLKIEAKNMTNLSREKIENLKSKVKGQIVLPSDSSYNEVRQIWNAMIERRPALIVRCAEADDVPPAIAFARENGLEISIRGAGHNIAGNAVCDNGVMIDFSTMRLVRVDAEKKRAYVEPGATLADFDEAAQSHGLATPVGINSTTGIAGLTLGGGFGWLTRKYGMTIDNLLSVDAVTADGERIRASENENADLFWAIRGGGGNFAVVTRFEFKLHEVGPEILAGLIVFPFDQAKQVLEKAILPQYALYNHGRWAVHSKPALEFIGWCGLKLIPGNEIDLGYRFKQSVWGKGFATEAAYACLKYGFEVLNLRKIIGRAMPANMASQRVLEKIGMQFTTEEEVEGHPARTYEIYNPLIH